MKTKMLALVTIMILLFNSVSVFADSLFAGEHDEEYGEGYLDDLSEDVKNALITAKSNFDIDEQYDDFSFETFYKYEHEIYSFRWQDTTNQKELFISIDSDGSFLYYSAPDNDKTSLLSDVKQDEAIKSAENFIEKVIPERADELELFEVLNNNHSFEFKFAKNVNNIFPMYDDTTVEVSKQDGEVLEFSTCGKYFLDKINEKADDLIDKETAKKAFIDNGGIKLEYLSDFDDEKKSAVIHPVYLIESLSINAHNANVVNSSSYYIDGRRDSDYLPIYEGMVSWDSNGEDWGIEPQKEIAEERKDFISSDEAKNALRKYNLVNNNIDVSECNIYKSKYNKDECLWEFSAEDDAASGNRYRYEFAVDAKTGKIEKFKRLRNYYEDRGEILSEEDAVNKSNQYFNLLCPEIANDLSCNYIFYNYYNNRYVLRFCRKINDIEFEFDSNFIDIEIDAKTGELFEFDKVWYNDINIIDKQINLTPNDVFEIYAKNSDFKLCYKYVMNEETESYDNIDIVYSGKKDSYHYIDVETGKMLTYSGDEVEFMEVGYSDISDSKYEDEINMLYDSGFYLERNEFNPNGDMTKSDFIELLYSGFITRTNTLYKYYYDDDILSKIDSFDDVMTKNDCAEILMYVMGCEKIAGKDELFDNIYSDVDLKHRAEANITTALSIIEADGDMFNGDKIISNEEGAHIVYNLISNYFKKKF